MKIWCPPILLTGAVGLIPWPGAAQIIRDGTFGLPGGGLTGPAYQIPADLGRKVGHILLHSFGQFNLNSRESATFSGPNDVQNVSSRVTGEAAGRMQDRKAVQI